MERAVSLFQVTSSVLNSKVLYFLSVYLFHLARSAVLGSAFVIGPEDLGMGSETINGFGKGRRNGCLSRGLIVG